MRAKGTQNKYSYQIVGDIALVEIANSDIMAIIDAEDVDVLEGRCWYRTGYKRNYVGSGRSKVVKGYGKYERQYWVVYLHHAVWKKHNDIPKGLEIDHKNCNPLDNRKSNLRLATKSQQRANTKKYYVSPGEFTTPYKGVTKYGDNYLARIENRAEDGSYVPQCGWFKTAEEAAKQVDIWYTEKHGEYARLNFPKEE